MIGVDVSDRSVKIVRLSDRLPRRLLANCMQDVPSGVMESGVIQDARQMEEVLRKALAACGIPLGRKTTVVASIPETQSFLRVVELPVLPEDEIGEAVQWEVAQHIPFGLENVYVDWQSLNGAKSPFAKASGGRQEILVGAAQKKVVDPLLRAMAALALDVAAFELESQALTRALVSKDLRGKQGVVVVDLGGASTNVVVHDHGTVRFTASLQKGSDRIRDSLAPEEIAAINNTPDSIPPPMAATVEGKLSAMYQELVQEVRGIVEFYNSIDRTHEVREIVLTGGGSNFPGMGKAFLQVFSNVHVQRGNPWVNVMGGAGRERQTPLSIGESVRYATALGLALRRVLI